jgi:nicotinamidase-related amidase
MTLHHGLKLDREQTLLLVIDLQTKLLPLIPNHDRLVSQVCRLIRGAAIFDVPVVATEQYPQGIGHTDPAVAAELHSAGAKTCQKMAFSVCGDAALREFLNRIDRPQIVVCGIEAHVCVLQTGLDLLAQDYGVFVCADAVGSRHPRDADLGLGRLRQAGAVIATIESVLFELCEECGTERFKRMLELIKQT